MKFLRFSQTKLGSSLSLPAHGWVGARATLTLAAHFALRNTRSNPVEKLVRRNFFGAKPKQAGKKEGGWGEGIFARSCLPFPFRLRKEKAEGGFGGNSAFLLRNQIVDSPAVLLVKSRTTQKSFLFLLEEKNRRAQIKNCEENFFAWWRGFRATAGLASLLGVFLKKCSNFVQKTPPSFIFSEIERCCLGAKRLGMVFFRNFKGIFEIQTQSAVGNAEVRRAKLWSRLAGQTNLFSFVRQRADEMLSVFFFDCPKANFKTLWTT